MSVPGRNINLRTSVSILTWEDLDEVLYGVAPSRPSVARLGGVEILQQAGVAMDLANFVRVLP